LDSKLITPVLLSIVVAWGMYRRVRRNIGRQPVNSRRLHIRIGIFVVIGALVGFFSLRDMRLLGALLGGFCGGAALAYLGLQHTKFEATAQGRFYTPHTYIGLFVSALFMGRIVFRFLSLHLDAVAAADPNQNPLGSYQKSPLTLAIFGVLIGYYVLFNIGVLRTSQNLTYSAPVNS
jgi:cytochrome b561